MSTAISFEHTGLPIPEANNVLHFGRVPEAANAYLLAQYAIQKGGQVVFIASSENAAAALKESFGFFAPNIPAFAFPAWDTLPYDRISPSAEVTAERIATLSALLKYPGKTQVIFTSIQAVSQKLLPKEIITTHTHSLKKGDEVARDALNQLLIAAGYHRTSKVLEAGEFSLRGSIVDIFPTGCEQAVRLDFFGDEIESIRTMDVSNQLGGETLSAIDILPMREVLLNEESIRLFREGYRTRFGNVKSDDSLYTHISNGQNHPGMEHWLGLFYSKLDSFFDYLHQPLCFMHHQALAAFEAHMEAVDDYYTARSQPENLKISQSPYHAVEPELHFLDSASLQQALQTVPLIEVSPFQLEAGENHVNLPFSAVPDVKSKSDLTKHHLLEGLKILLEKTAEKILVACNSEGSKQRLATMMESQHIVHHSVLNTHHIDDLPSHAVGLSITPISKGFSCAEYILFSEQDILGERIIRTTKKRKKSEVFLQEAASFEAGELVVHREHGIGKFDGLITLDVNNIKHDCIKLTYQGGDRLFIPVENIELITRYGQEEGNAELDKLGGVSWQKRKAALKKKLKMAASALMKIAAKRELVEAPIIETNHDNYARFAAAFPYTETDDQLRAIDEVLADLQSGKAMDRLVCGDVGFGKTEVAMRAAFAAVSQGLQVAMVVPTTLLARQHYQNFSARFQGFSTRIAQLSRMVSNKQAEATKQALKEGKIDIVVGTHALLSDGIKFKQLGLLIIDEEQHFGVKQKEKLKDLKADIHVLTLSATPIPRTLQLSLSGIRELSLITTPPLDRLAIRSVVMPFDSVIIRDAILREKHRGGQSFYVTPRVKYIDELHAKLKDLIPEVSVAIAHGQMAPGKLDKVMQDFSDGKYDVLLSTTIIESGIDIATANTMIIDHPELFGLSQLYQLRGRVGRGKLRAHAYFTLPQGRMLTHNATRRLEVMQKLDHLGAGFSLASHDMDIRGFGNVLGEEQSGHIKEVGIELYQAMLEEAIEEMKAIRLGGNTQETQDFSPQINIGMPVLIPETYVEDLGLRLSLYRRAGALSDDAEVDDFIDEITDRFGTPPNEVRFLLEIMRLKIFCKRAGIIKLDAGEKAMVIEFHPGFIKKPDALIALIAANPKRYKLRANQTVLVQQPSGANADRINHAIEIAKQFADINHQNLAVAS